MVAQPHFLLFCDTHHSDSQASAAGGYTGSGGRWHFVLEQLDGSERLEAADSERSMNRERLALLSVVRGLEALEQPSQVSLVTTSRYVSRGLRYGLSSWRESDYTWERFGEQRPVRNSDLWRRVDTALQFHGIKCRLIQAGPSNPELARSEAADIKANSPVTSGLEVAGPGDARGGLPSAECLSDHRNLRAAMHTPVARPTELARPIGNALITRRYAVGPAIADPAMRNSARPVRRLPKPRQTIENQRNFSCHRYIWWNLVVSWIRGWRGRLQNRHAIYGT